MANSKPTLGFSGCFSEPMGSQDVVGAETTGSADGGAETLGPAAGAGVQGTMVGAGTVNWATTTL